MITDEFGRRAALVTDLGFLLDRDLPTDDHDALLVVALRESPTRLHFDPELVEYWASDATGRGRRSTPAAWEAGARLLDALGLAPAPLRTVSPSSATG
jgi:hypothetical protein